MNVYVAFYFYDYEGSHTIGAFSTRELAEVRLRQLGYHETMNYHWQAGTSGQGDGAFIEEMTVDKSEEEREFL